MAQTKCFGCKNDIKRLEKTTKCFVCHSEFHLKCTGTVGVTEDKLKHILELNNVKYVCFFCENNDVMKEIKDLKGKLQTYLDLMLKQNEMVERITVKVESINGADCVDKVRSFSDAVKKNNAVIVVQPLNENQRSEKTQQEVKTKIDPTKLAIRVETIRNVSKGGIAISCSNNNSKEKLKSSVEKELGNNYKVIEPKLREPQLIITGVEDEVIGQDNEKILNSILEQNFPECVDEDIKEKIKVQRKYSNKGKKNFGNVILSVSSDYYKKIIGMGKINIGWRKCNVYEHINIIRCYKCSGYNHFARDCTSSVACGKCAESHITKDCNNDFEKCINCLKMIEKLKVNINVDHIANDRNCECYKRVINKITSKIKYE